MAETRKVYLDHSATTPADPRVVEAMLPYLTEKFGNASSVHFFGQEARAAVDRARREVAALIGARANEVVFVSGGTEANNLAIQGICDLQAFGQRSHHHFRLLNTHRCAVFASPWKKSGWDVTWLPAYEEGVVRVDDVRDALRPNTVLISVMLANNEIGTHSACRGHRRARERGTRLAVGDNIWFHVDAVQAAGRIPINVETLGCDLLSLSGHKLYSTKGTGALFVRRGVRLAPQNVGGHQERERRAGTEAVPGIVALGTAAKLAKEEMDQNSLHVSKLRDMFEAGVSSQIEDIVFNGDRSRRLPHLSNISFRFIEGEGLLISLDLQGIAVSTGSACSSGTLEPSPVIRALGRNDELARGSIRFSFGKDNTEEDVAYVLEVLTRVVARLRALSPLNKTRVLEAAVAE